MSRSLKIPRRRYQSDAALSFAGEDRKVAAALSRHLKRFGLSVFYDADHQADLWGKRQNISRESMVPRLDM